MIEIIVVIAIMLIILGIGSYSFITARQNVALDTIADGIVFSLEQAKTNAQGGRDGQGSGVRFTSTSYIYFNGDSYSPTDPSNMIRDIDTGYNLTATLTDAADTIIFARLTGLPSVTGSVIVTDLSSTRVRTIVVGDQGGITVIK